ncbi:sensor histidine kinase YesM [Pedobacter cryoconitis]|uniref:sensor histidine kinase n=1 Tax=Pedobacter cryoconitis TaxID=188932 RepID=UPI001621BFDF|nr:histidine kinase [Pedobacter cryoconitis]MBB6270833.1 sensor histidine kinase YesM [Pedobacter cryoconitis]
MNKLDNCETDQYQEKGLNNFSKISWLRLNLFNLAAGPCIGLTLCLLMSAFKGQWIGTKGLIYQMLFSTVIAFCIVNTIFISQKVLKLTKGSGWLFLIVYYLSSIIGMLIAIEMIYLIKALLFNQEYHFLHLEDARFSLVVVVIVCTVIHVYTSQKKIMNAKLREKNINMLQLSQMKTQAELATLQSKINPHFLYNSLNAIASLIHEDPDKAERMTIQLSKLFRYSINQNQESLVTVQEEMEIVSTYLDIERVRFGDRIDFVIAVDNELSADKIPRFLIQPLVENALKHGLKNVADHGLLRIEIQKAAKITISIIDNGIPFPDELETGYGLQSTYEKLQLLYNDDYEVQILNQPIKQIKIIIPFTHG